jgi:hypothetical protein
MRRSGSRYFDAAGAHKVRCRGEEQDDRAIAEEARKVLLTPLSAFPSGVEREDETVDAALSGVQSLGNRG